MVQEHKFKRSFFGGFRREDVIGYVEQLMNEMQSDKAVIDELKARLAALESAERASAEASDDEAPSADVMSADEINDEVRSKLSDLDALLQSYLGGGSENE